MSDVKLVISRHTYSHAEQATDGTWSGDSGTEKALVGIATDRTEALNIIQADHKALMETHQSHILDHPIQKVSDDEYKIFGQDYTWQILSVETNTVVNQEL
ncbi:hypothetical protein D3C87_279420 [compost metagenome]